MSELVDTLKRREQIFELERFVGELPQLEQQLTHHHCPGLYARELFIPKDSVLVGKIHRYACFNVMPLGRMLIASETGNRVIEAPFAAMSPPGTKRAGIALEDSIWITVHPTKNTDLVKLEAELIAKDYDEFKLLPRMRSYLRRLFS